MYVAGSLSKLLQTNSLGIMSPTLMAPSPCFTGTFCSSSITTISPFSTLSNRPSSTPFRTSSLPPMNFPSSHTFGTVALLHRHLLLLLHHDDLPLLHLVEQTLLNALQDLLAPADELSVQPHVRHRRLPGPVLQLLLDRRPAVDLVQLNDVRMDSYAVEGRLRLLAKGTARLAEEGDAVGAGRRDGGVDGRGGVHQHASGGHAERGRGGGASPEDGRDVHRRGSARGGDGAEARGGRREGGASAAEGRDGGGGETESHLSCVGCVLGKL